MKFQELNLSDTLLEAISFMGFEEATPIQEQAIPAIMEHKDLIASAQTGTGKTAAFIYDGYWEDIGTISSYFDANIALINNKVGLKTYNESQPIYTQSNHLPGAKLHEIGRAHV